MNAVPGTLYHHTLPPTTHLQWTVFPTKLFEKEMDSLITTVFDKSILQSPYPDTFAMQSVPFIPCGSCGSICSPQCARSSSFTPWRPQHAFITLQCLILMRAHTWRSPFIFCHLCITSFLSNVKVAWQNKMWHLSNKTQTSMFHMVWKCATRRGEHVCHVNIFQAKSVNTILTENGVYNNV